MAFGLKRLIEEPVVNYNDFYLRIAMSIAASQILLMYNEQVTFFNLLLQPGYYLSLLGSFLIAFLLVNYIYIVTIGLDKNFDWKNHTTKRLGWQVLLGFAIPALGAFLLAALFFAVNRMNILQTTYLDQDYTIILIMLLIVNLYYFGLNSFLLRDEPSKETDNNNGASKE